MGEGELCPAVCGELLLEGERGGLEQGDSAMCTFGTETEGTEGSPAWRWIWFLIIVLLWEGCGNEGQIRPGGGPAWCCQGRSDGA